MQINLKFIINFLVMFIILAGSALGLVVHVDTDHQNPSDYREFAVGEPFTIQSIAEDSGGVDRIYTYESENGGVGEVIDYTHCGGSTNCESPVMDFVKDEIGYFLYLAYAENAGGYAIDEILINITPGCIDEDEDGYGSNIPNSCDYEEEDCDDNNASINPGMPEICNGIDDNCNEDIDEDFIPESCGTDQCIGNTQCVGGNEICDSAGEDCGTCCICSQGLNPGQGYDPSQNNDCEATDCPDDGCGYDVCGVNIYSDYPGYVNNVCSSIFQCTENSCDDVVECELDVDQDEYSESCGDCDDHNASIHPDADELCNGEDEDCDNEIDEGFDNESCDYVCEDEGYVWTENGGSLNCCGNDYGEDDPYEDIELSCDNHDNDCDGTTDNIDDTCGTGACTGTKLCTAGEWGYCSSYNNTCDDPYDETGCEWGHEFGSDVGIRYHSFLCSLTGNCDQHTSDWEQYLDCTFYQRCAEQGSTHICEPVECVQDDLWGEHHEFKCAGDGTYFQCTNNNVYDQINVCHSNCSITAQCNGTAPGGDLQTCDYNYDFLGDYCDDSCQLAEHEVCESQHTGCTSSSQCQGVLPGTNNCSDICIYDELECVDIDQDGYGIENLDLCDHSEFDCDDANASIHPNAPELCDYVDNDCDGTIDEGCDCWEDGQWGEGHQFFCRQDNTFDECIDNMYYHRNECGSNCTASALCVGEIPLHEFNTCGAGAHDYFKDYCDATCQLAEHETCSTGYDCTGEALCFGLDPGDDLNSCSQYATYLGDYCSSECRVADNNTCLAHFSFPTCTAHEYCDGQPVGGYECDYQCMPRYIVTEICGDGILNQSLGEQCELNDTQNNNYCPNPSTSECEGNKTKIRDQYGDCDNDCQCDYDPWSDPVCVFGSCGATCEDNSWCGTTPCGHLDGCYNTSTSSKWRACPNVQNICNDGCRCEESECPDGNTCPLTGADLDQDNFDTECGDCDDSNSSINPIAIEICNGVDDNCNGYIDEGCDCIEGETRECGSNVGECQTGLETCINGTWGECEGAVWPSAEICDDLDNDCDHETDEDFEEENCEYVCEAGNFVWTNNGELLNCCGNHDLEDDPYEEIEISCDGHDNDCNGSIDDHCECTPGETRDCGIQGEICSGTQTCIEGGVWGNCSTHGNICSTLECENLTTECRTYYDIEGHCDTEGFCEEPTECNDYSNQPETTQCGEDYQEYDCPWGNDLGNDTGIKLHDFHCDGLGDCGEYIEDWAVDEYCSMNESCYWDGQGYGDDNYYCYLNCTDEVCNGIDDDCDGLIDEDFTEEECYYTCEDHGYIWTGNGDPINCCGNHEFEDSPYQSYETLCDYQDNDCDGVIDEGCECIPGQQRYCSTDVGECRRGIQKCVEGRWDVCLGGIFPVMEICDWLDNDCDGLVDEDACFRNSRDSLHFSRIQVLNDYVLPGDQLVVIVEIENKEPVTMEDITITVLNDELDIRKKIGPFDLRKKRSLLETVILDVPNDALPGEYDLRITASNDDIRRVRYREFVIVEQNIRQYFHSFISKYIPYYNKV